MKESVLSFDLPTCSIDVTKEVLSDQSEVFDVECFDHEHSTRVTLCHAVSEHDARNAATTIYAVLSSVSA